MFLPRWFDYGTYLPTAERREQIAHRWAPLPVCICASVCVHTVCVSFFRIGLSVCMCKCLYGYVLCMCAFAIQCTAQECVCLPLAFSLILTCKPLCVKVWDVSSGVWLWGDLSCGNIQVWDPSLSVGLTSDGKDLPRRLLTKLQLCMIQELSQCMLCWGQTFHTYIRDVVHFSLYKYIQCLHLLFIKRFWLLFNMIYTILHIMKKRNAIYLMSVAIYKKKDTIGFNVTD